MGNRFGNRTEDTLEPHMVNKLRSAVVPACIGTGVVASIECTGGTGCIANIVDTASSVADEAKHNVEGHPYCMIDNYVYWKAAVDCS